LGYIIMDGCYKDNLSGFHLPFGSELRVELENRKMKS